MVQRLDLPVCEGRIPHPLPSALPCFVPVVSLGDDLVQEVSDDLVLTVRSVDLEVAQSHERIVERALIPRLQIGVLMSVSRPDPKLRHAR